MALETAANEFVELFKRHLNSKTQAQIRLVTCTSVDWAEKTMEAEGLSDELPYYDVSLGFGSCDVKPKLDSVCIIGILEGHESVAWLIYASDTELVEFNGGTNGGLTNTPELQTQLNNTNQLLQSIISVINSTIPITEPGNGSPSALQTALQTAIVGKQLGDFSKIEDTKITH